jgi:predicted  nucleic acid-binding Zn-ribbon protein
MDSLQAFLLPLIPELVAVIFGVIGAYHYARFQFQKLREMTEAFKTQMGKVEQVLSDMQHSISKNNEDTVRLCERIKSVTEQVHKNETMMEKVIEKMMGK